MKRLLCIFLTLTLWQPSSTRAQDAEALGALVGVLKESDDSEFQLDILKGIAAALKGQRNLKPPKGWDEVAARLGHAPNKEVRQLALSLSLTFGSKMALTTLRMVVEDD